MKLLVSVVVRDRKLSITTWWNETIDVPSLDLDHSINRWILDKMRDYCQGRNLDFTKSHEFLEVISISHSILPD